MEYDKGFGGGGFGILLDFVGDFDDWKGWFFELVCR